MTNHYVATVPVKFTDNDGQERTRFQRVGAMFRNTRNGDGSEFFSLKLDFPVAVQELVMFPPSCEGTTGLNPLTRMGRPRGGPFPVPGKPCRRGQIARRRLPALPVVYGEKPGPQAVLLEIKDIRWNRTASQPQGGHPK